MNDRPSQPPLPTEREERVSVLVGDRLCIGCGYNLTGQPVLREPHYRLLIVRCPECATVAGLQEYPVLGRWANRWAALVAALWFVVLLAFAFGSSASLFGMSIVSGEEACRPYRERLHEGYQDWLRELHPDQNVSQWWTLEPFEDYWKTVDPAALLAQAGGWATNVEWQWTFFWIVIVLVASAQGAFWSTALLTTRRGALLTLGLLLIAIPCAIGLVGSWPALFALDARSASHAAWAQVGVRFQAFSQVVALLGLWAGMLLGRSIVRGLVRALLPPRLRGALAGLWTCDGLDPPSGARPPARN